MPTYRARTTGTSLAFSKNAGTPSVKIGLESLFDTAAPDAPIPQDHPSRLTADLWLTEKTADRTVETLRGVFGWQGTSFEELNEPNDLIGVEVDVVWDWEEYEGKYSAKVQWINAPGAQMMKRADPAEAARVAAQYNHLLRPAGSRPAGRPAPAARPAPGTAPQRTAAAPASRPQAPRQPVQAPPMDGEMPWDDAPPY